ncbi:MAG: T9SS type A sorting domain-containing protein [Bacteroidia bacterium]
MKRQLLIILLFSLTGMLSAQRWTPVMLNDTFHYRLDGDSVISGTFLVESYNVSSGDTTFYFNRTGCVNCLFIPNSISGCDTCNGLRNQPAVVGGYSLVKNANGTCIFNGMDTAVLQTLAMPGDSWAFVPSRNITALLVSADTATVFGQPDSVKTIQLSSGDTVVFSAGHGIIRWPQSFGGNRNFNLIGIQNRNLGVRLRTLKDYYDFQPGDILQYQTNYLQTWGSFPRTQGLIKVTILQRQDFPDSINYYCRFLLSSYTSSMNMNGPPPYSTFRLDSVTFSISTCADYYLNKPNKEVIRPHSSHSFCETFSNNNIGCSDSSFYPEWAVMEFSLDSLGRNSVHYGDPESSGIYHFWTLASANSDTLIAEATPPTPYSTVSTRYTEGLGIVFGHWYEYNSGQRDEWLIGYYKGVDTVGIIHSDAYLGVGVEENLLQFVKLFPNPASEALRIELADLSETAQIDIINLQGEIVQRISTVQAVTTISTSELAAGMYLLRVQTDEGLSVQRVVIQH